MDVISMIKTHVQEVEAQLNINLNEKCLKPIVFVDNTNFNGEDDTYAIVHLELFDSKDVVTLKSRQVPNNMFSIVNMIGENTAYIVWGSENIDTLKFALSEWDYPITEATKFIDLKEEASKFLNANIDSFEDIKPYISFAEENMDTIFSSKETVMYSLFIELLNRGYSNEAMESTLVENINMCDLSYVDNAHKGEEFRKTKTSIVLEKKEEVAYLEKMVNDMHTYNEDIRNYLEVLLRTRELDEAHYKLLSEKATIHRYKKDMYGYVKSLINIYKNEEEIEYTFYLNSLELYCLMEDASMYTKAMNNNNKEYAEFIATLGEYFLNTTSSVAYSFILRKNILSKLTRK